MLTYRKIGHYIVETPPFMVLLQQTRAGWLFWGQEKLSTWRLEEVQCDLARGNNSGE